MEKLTRDEIARAFLYETAMFDNPAEIKAKLDEVVHEFFTKLKPVDPEKGFD